MEPVNESDLEWSDRDHGETQFRRKQLGTAAGSEDLGCSLYELPAGARSWPYHYHTANEEALYVLSGRGTIRLDGEEFDLGEGDYVPLPANETGGHRVINDGDDPLRYIAISTMNDPDVTVYPDSEKLGVFVGAPPGSRDDRSLYGYYRIDDDVSYWEED